MKRLLVLGLIGALSVVGIFLSTTQADATKFSSGGDVSVAKDEVVNGSYYSTSDKLVIKGSVYGDVYCGGSSVEITGTVEGDVLCAARNINISGAVKGDVRVAAQTVDLSGTVDGSLNAMAATVNTDSDFHLVKDATIMAATANLEGRFERDMVVSASSVKFAGELTRNMTLSSDNFHLGDKSNIFGDLDYTRSSDIELDKSKVHGNITRHQSESTTSKTTIGTVLGSIIVLVAMVVIYPLILPKTAREINAYGRKDPIYTVLVGVAAVAVVPLASIIIMFTVIGIPLGVVLLLSLIVAGLVGYAQGAAFLGQLMLGKSTKNILLQTLGGGLVLAILLQIPYVNILVGLVWIFVGTGLVVRYVAKHLLVKPKYS